MGNSPDQLACIESNSIKVLEIGDMETLTSLDPIIFYSMSKLTSLKVITLCFYSDFYESSFNNKYIMSMHFISCKILRGLAGSNIMLLNAQTQLTKAQYQLNLIQEQGPVLTLNWKKEVTIGLFSLVLFVFVQWSMLGCISVLDAQEQSVRV